MLTPMCVLNLLIHDGICSCVCVFEDSNVDTHEYTYALYYVLTYVYFKVCSSRGPCVFQVGAEVVTSGALAEVASLVMVASVGVMMVALVAVETILGVVLTAMTGQMGSVTAGGDMIQAEEAVDHAGTAEAVALASQS